VAEAGTK